MLGLRKQARQERLLLDYPVDAGRVVSLLVAGTLSVDVQANELIRNTCELRWTSLPGEPTTAENGDVYVIGGGRKFEFVARNSVAPFDDEIFRSSLAIR